MFYTNAFVNLNLPATVLFLLSRTWRWYLYLCPLCITTSHRWQSAVCCWWRWRSSAFHLTYIATSSDPWTNLWRWLSGNSTLFQYSLDPLIDTKLVGCGEMCVKAWMRDLTLHSGVRHWGWVSERKCVLNITDIMTVTCLKMDVTSLNQLQSLLGLAFLWWVAIPLGVWIINGFLFNDNIKSNSGKP